MTPKNFSRMRNLALLACVASLSACAGTDGGYYDANGNYIPTSRPHNIEKGSHSPLPGGVRNDGYHGSRGDYVGQYDRRGYYDRNGYYIAKDSGLTVPESMFPPSGMCRVCFPERPAVDQPAIESCLDIGTRVPNGAYVIYGG